MKYIEPNGLKNILLEKGGKLLGSGDSFYWAIKTPFEHITNAKYRNFISRIKHFFSKYSMLPYVSFHNGYYETTYIFQKNKEIIVTYKPVNADGSEIKPEFAFGTFMPLYTKVEKDA